jgi:hypothetical protein
MNYPQRENVIHIDQCAGKIVFLNFQFQIGLYTLTPKTDVFETRSVA